MIGERPKLFVNVYANFVRSYSESHYNLGIVYMHIGRDAEALHQFQTAVSIAPESAEASRNNLAQFYLAHADVPNGQIWAEKV